MADFPSQGKMIYNFVDIARAYISLELGLCNFIFNHV